MSDWEPKRDRIIFIKGAGEKASAVAHALYCAGFRKVTMTDLPVPRAERRGVSFSEAIIDWRKEIEGVIAERTEPSLDEIAQKCMENKIPVIADPDSTTLHSVKPHIFIDAVMAKRNMGTTLQNAPLVIALGPGFEVGKDCHFAVETNPASPSIGRAVLEGPGRRKYTGTHLRHGLYQREAAKGARSGETDRSQGYR